MRRVLLVAALVVALSLPVWATPIGKLAAQQQHNVQVGDDTKCFAKCAIEGAACIAQCPKVSTGMLGAPELSCRASCDVKAAACTAMCALADEEPQVNEEALAPVDAPGVGGDTKCFAKCAVEGAACIAQCPKTSTGMLGAPEVSCRTACDIKAAACTAECALAADEPVAEVDEQLAADETTNVGGDTKCFAKCAIEGAACVAQCPKITTGMMGAPEVSCKTACDIKTAACTAECALATEEEEPAQLEVAAPAVGGDTKCFAKCAVEGAACIAQCPKTSTGMLGAPEVSCRTACDIKAAACTAECALAVSAPAASSSPVAEFVSMSPSALCSMRRAFVGSAALPAGKTCPSTQPTCQFLPGQIECCLPGEGCIPNVGCRC